jgi:hypothetical protein
MTSWSKGFINPWNCFGKKGVKDRSPFVNIIAIDKTLEGMKESRDWVLRVKMGAKTIKVVD